MLASEQQEIVLLGKLRAASSLLEQDLPKDPKIRQKFLEARKLLNEVTNQQWDVCSGMITKDDT